MGVFSKKSPEANWPIQPSTRSTATPRWRNEVLGEPMTLEEDAVACQARCSGRLGTVEAAIRTLVWEYHEMLVRAMVELGARTFGGLGEPWVPRLLIGMKWLRAATDSGFNYFSKALLLFWGPVFWPYPSWRRSKPNKQVVGARNHFFRRCSVTTHIPSLYITKQ